MIQKSGHMVLKGVNCVHNNKLGQMIFKGVIWVHNATIRSYGLERSHWVQYTKQTIIFNISWGKKNIDLPIFPYQAIAFDCSNQTFEAKWNFSLKIRYFSAFSWKYMHFMQIRWKCTHFPRWKCLHFTCISNRYTFGIMALLENKRLLLVRRWYDLERIFLHLGKLKITRNKFKTICFGIWIFKKFFCTMHHYVIVTKDMWLCFRFIWTLLDSSGCQERASHSQREL